MPAAVYLPASKFIPFKLQTNLSKAGYICIQSKIFDLLQRVFSWLLFSFLFWRKGEDGEAAVCVSWGLIQLNNGLRLISGNIYSLKRGKVLILKTYMQLKIGKIPRVKIYGSRLKRENVFIAKIYAANKKGEKSWLWKCNSLKSGKVLFVKIYTAERGNKSWSHRMYL